MAEISASIVEADDLTIITVVGPVTSDEIADATHRHYGEGKPRNVIWDFRGADVSGIQSADVERLLQVALRYAQYRPGGKTVFVQPGDLGFGLSRMGSILADNSGHPVPLAVFRDMDAARQWLDTRAW